MPAGAAKGLGGINGRGAPAGGVTGRLGGIPTDAGVIGLGGIAVEGGPAGRLGRPLGAGAVIGGRPGIGTGGGETGRGTGIGIGGGPPTGGVSFGAAVGEGAGAALISSGVAIPWIFLKLKRMGVKILKLTSWVMAWLIWPSISKTVFSSELRFWGARTPIMTRPIWPASKGIFSSGKWNFSAICPIKTALTSEKSADLRSAGSLKRISLVCSLEGYSIN